MGRPPKVIPDDSYLSTYRVGKPQALETEIATDAQKAAFRDVLTWGTANDLPTVIMDAVNKSPTATNTLSRVAMFIRGDSFSDKDLMKKPVDKDGTTLWELHSKICDQLALLNAFAVRFTYNPKFKITNSFQMGAESVRFVKPKVKDSRKISHIDYNPYWGTEEYNQEYSTVYPTFNLNNVKQEIEHFGTNYRGQVYFYRRVRPPYKHYPVPGYWSAKESIFADHYFSIYIKELLENGFFQSVLMNMVGDPNQISKDPEYSAKIVTKDDGTQVTEHKKTVGEVFNLRMAKMFSGVQKAGAVMTMWANSIEKAPQLQAFPSNANFDLVNGAQLSTIRTICTATQCQAILANLPQQISSLGSDGNSMQKAVELMQANASDSQRMLENFYNEILLKNSEETTTAKVKIRNYSPIDTDTTIDDKYWEFMNEQEKLNFLQNNVPQFTAFRQVTPVTGTTPTEPQAGNEALKNINLQQLARIQKMVGKYNKGEMTYEQAKQFLAGFGFTEEQMAAWLTDETGEL